MKLELKHIAPYLPYRLKMAFIIRDEIIKVGVLNEVSVNNSDTHPIRYSIDTLNELEHEWMFKLILRPLSDLTKEIEVNGEKFVPIDYFEIGDDDNETYEYDNGNINLIQDLEYLSANRLSLDIVFIPYGVIQKLLEWYFDVFGLIEQGLAIDINTLKK